MKKTFKHISSSEHAQQAQTQHSEAREFASVEAALREDRAAVTVPPAVEQRLSESIEQLPKPDKPWWKKLMG
jgi:hypothetical protein